MSEIKWLGGHRIIHEGGQKGLEAAYLLLFKDSKEGKNWLKENKVINTKRSESPDYLFETESGDTLGLEITNLVIKTDTQLATVSLITIAKQVCQYFKKTKKIALSILIDPVRKSFFARTKKEMLEAAYNPCFSKLDATNKEIKEAIITALSQDEIKPNGMLKTSIKIGTRYFNITATRWDEPHTEATVNNAGMCKEDPIEELQEAITAKDNKLDNYKEKCVKCDLLVVSDSSSTGNFVYFTNKVKSHKFETNFRNVYLLNLSSWDNNERVVTLKINPCKINHN